VLSVDIGQTLSVTVASIAIIASVTVSAITLRRNANQFEQSRLDKRTDKLREELVALIGSITERNTQFDVVTARIDRIKDEKPANMEEFYRSLKATLSEHLWTTYQRISFHAFTVLMLTEDRRAAEQIVAILRAIAEERKAMEDLATPGKTFVVNPVESAELDKKIKALNGQIAVYAMLNLGVTAYPSAHAHPLRDLLFPETT
jgi:septal ring factor EnvC (AmiA/AmiB activator)